MLKNIRRAISKFFSTSSFKALWKNYFFWITVFLLLTNSYTFYQNYNLQTKLDVIKQENSAIDNRVIKELLDNLATAKKLGLSDNVRDALIDSAMKELGYSEYDTEFENEETEESTSSNDSSYSLGEAVEFNDNSKITVNTINEAPAIDMYDVPDGYTKVVLDVTIENIGTTPLDVNSQRFSVYDSNLEIGEFNASTYSNNIPNEIAAGMKANLVIHFTTKSKGPFSISYADAVWKQ